MKKLSLLIVTLVLAPPYMLASPLSQYMIESRKARSVASLFEQFSPCQLTIIANQLNSLRLITAIQMPIQIFLLAFEYGQPSTPLTVSIIKLRNLTFYPVFYGQQYIVKSWKPVCKLNAISYRSKSGKLEVIGSIFFANFISKLCPAGISFSNHFESRSVFEFDSTYNFFLFQNQEPGSTSQVLEILSNVFGNIHRFWTLTVLPSDSEYLNMHVTFSLWFVTLVKNPTKLGHPPVHLGEFHIRFRSDELIENFLHNTGNLVHLIKLNLQNSGRNFRYALPETTKDEVVRFIQSNFISSPLDYMKHIGNERIWSTYELVYAFAVSDANLSFTFDHYKKDRRTNVAFCRETPFYSIMGTRNFNFPFSFVYDDHFFSIVTCSGKEDVGYSLEILFSPFQWLTWICVFGCAGLILALITIFGNEKFDFRMIVNHGILLVSGIFGSEISIANGMLMKKLQFFVSLWTFVGILLNTLYQGVLMETLIFPKQYETNLTLESMVRQNFTLSLIPERTLNQIVYENALKGNFIDSLYYKYSQSACTKFYRQMIRSFVFRLMTALAYENLVVNVCGLKLENCKNWTQVFATKPYIPRIPVLLKPHVNSSTLLTQLSRCTANTAFIHNRVEMMKIFEPKLPEVIHPYRRKLKFIPLADDIVDSIEIFACEADVGNVVQPYIRKYVESGLHEMRERFAGILKFRWISMKRSEYVNLVSLDEKLLAIFFSFSVAYACHFIALCAEIFSGWQNIKCFSAMKKQIYPDIFKKVHFTGFLPMKNHWLIRFAIRIYNNIFHIPFFVVATIKMLSAHFALSH